MKFMREPRFLSSRIYFEDMSHSSIGLPNFDSYPNGRSLELLADRVFLPFPHDSCHLS